MEKGMAIIEQDDTQTKAVFIDQEVLEFARMSKETKKRIAAQEEAQRKEICNRRKAEKQKAKRKAYTLHTAVYVLIRIAVAVACAWAGTAGMIHPVIYIPVTLFCLCTACLRLGTWFGRSDRNAHSR